ncbi:MAG: hypothetical protein A2096_02770 [Spirochaetes bacterium GWF1_41_5]|nr:MAG: hypothetical protein A2096_02770 [Spirochaetes bacterium GWF1_41_5]HBE03309.1 hypothetical protein [Spirochaetia bacterium]
MKKTLMLILWIMSIAVGLFADNPQVLTIKENGIWKKKGEAIIRTTADAVAHWDTIELSTEIAADKYYCISMKVKSSVDTVDNLLAVVSKWNDNYQCVSTESYALNTVWSELFLFFYSGQNSEKVDFVLQCPGAFAQEIIIKDIKLNEQKESPDNLLPEGGFSADDKYPPLFIFKRVKGQEGLLTCGADESSLTGKSMHLLPGAGENIISSIALPVISGKKYKLEMWTKADQKISARLIVSDWFSPHRNEKSIGQSKTIAVFPEWKKESLEVSVPADLSEYPDLQARIVKIIIKTTPGAAQLWFFGISFSIIGEK